jgi:hypothetical protein
MLFSWTDACLAGAADDAWWAGQVYAAAVERREAGEAGEAGEPEDPAP